MTQPKQPWFEMSDLRNRSFDKNAWIPLRSNKATKTPGLRFAENHQEEFFGVSSAAFPLGDRAEVELAVGWGNLSLMHDHAPSVQDGVYQAADEFVIDSPSVRGTYLVLSQQGNALEKGEWHLHPDIILGLRLKREGDEWLSMEEGYFPVVRLERNEQGTPSVIEMRSSHLKDFLTARGQFLCLSTYASRELIADTRDAVNWPTTHFEEKLGTHDEWRGSITEITENGHVFGSSMAVFHVGRKDFDKHQDVPEIGHMDDFETETFTRTFDKGKKLFRIWGELWKVDYINPVEHSPRVRGDDMASLTYFYTDASGKKESAEDLNQKGRWLWFKPDVMNKALEFRGASLSWYTADTGRVSMGPDPGVPFGVNSLGLVNVYAKDIRYASGWQQQLWAGFNVMPEGGVSQELLMSQAEAEPADTQAPEAFLKNGLDHLNTASMRLWDFQAIRPHEEHERLIRASHRFRAVDKTGFHALAKDLARIIVDSLDVNGLQKVTPSPAGQKRGSLKSLEAVIATITTPIKARSLMTPLFGIYELRHADAHLPSSTLTDAYSMVFVDSNRPWIIQGAMMLAVVVDTLHRIAQLLAHQPGRSQDGTPL